MKIFTNTIKIKSTLKNNSKIFKVGNYFLTSWIFIILLKSNIHKTSKNY